MPNHWGGYCVALEPGSSPQFLAGGRIIRNQKLIATHDHLGAAGGLSKNRRRPTALHWTANAPDFVACLLVQRGHERVSSVEFLIAKQDHQILVEHRRGDDPQAHSRDASETLLPNQLAVEVVAVEAFRSEIDMHVLPIRDWCRRGVCSAAMAVIVDRAFVRGSLPLNFAGIAVKTEDFEGVKLI